MKVDYHYYSFDIERSIELVRSVTAETEVAQDKVDKTISLVKDIDELRSIRELTGFVGNYP